MVHYLPALLIAIEQVIHDEGGAILSGTWQRARRLQDCVPAERCAGTGMVHVALLAALIYSSNKKVIIFETCKLCLTCSRF